jgi:hypothetical protein
VPAAIDITNEACMILRVHRNIVEPYLALTELIKGPLSQIALSRGGQVDDPIESFRVAVKKPDVTRVAHVGRRVSLVKICRIGDLFPDSYNSLRVKHDNLEFESGGRFWEI